MDEGFGVDKGWVEGLIGVWEEELKGLTGMQVGEWEDAPSESAMGNERALETSLLPSKNDQKDTIPPLKSHIASLESDNTLSSSSSSSSCSPSSNPNQETTHLKTTLATLSQTITQLTTRLETLEQDKHRREMAEKNFIQNTTVNTPPPPLSSSGNRNSLRVLTTPPRVSSPLVVRNPFLRGGLGEEEDGKGIRSA